MPPGLPGIEAAAEAMGKPLPDNSIPIVEYAVGPGQAFAERFVFAKLPAQVVALGKKTIASIGS